jgi:glutamate-1-semialdehyde aminotransferase
VQLQQALQTEGVIIRAGGTLYLTTAHTDADIDFTLEVYARSLEKI